MTLEILSEADLKCIEERSTRNEHEAFYVTPKESAKIINTIKLQRQQLAEQERKVWNEAIMAASRKLKYELEETAWFDESVLDVTESLLKPESEASGEHN